MTIHERVVLDVTLIHLRGRVTVTEGADVLRQRLRQLISEGRTKLAVDFRDVPYVDSTTLGVLVRAYTTIAREGGALKLVHARGHVRQLLEITKLLQVFESFDSDAQALASFAAPPSALNR
jgi:anti-sigma B factor antagonist